MVDFITVANEGMLWTAKEDSHLHEENNNKPIKRDRSRGP